MKSTVIVASTFLFQAALPTCHCYCTGNLRDRDIAGIWRLRSKKSFLPSLKTKEFKRKEYTVFPPKKPKKDEESNTAKSHDVLLLLREDGHFVQYGTPENEKNSKASDSDAVSVIDGTSSLGTMKGSWALVDGKLILAADRPEDVTNLRSEGKKHDTMLAGAVVATSGKGLVDNPALINKNSGNDSDESADGETVKNEDNETEDVHLSVSGEISIGKFFYPQKHPSFFEQPMFGATSTGSFELRQVLGSLNTQVDDEEKLVEKFKKKDLMDKRYFLTSYPLPKNRKKKQRWSIKYNKYVDDKPKTKAEKEREEQEKNAPMPIKSFEVELFANNTFSTITGLGDTVLRGKWSIIGEERDQLWMSVWRFGFGRGVSGSTFSQGTHLTHMDDVSYWGKIYEVDAAVEEDSINDDPADWKGTKIEINGAVMLGVGLEPCSVARFTMIEKTEEDDYEDDYDDDDDEDEDDNYGNFGEPSADYDMDSEDENDDYDELPSDIGSFE